MPIVEAMIQGFAFTTYAAPKPAMAKMPRMKQMAMTSSTVWGFFAAGWRCGSSARNPEIATGV